MSLSNTQILVVSRQSWLIKKIKHLVSGFDLRLVTVSDASEAQQVLQRDKSFHAILSDMLPSHGDNFELLYWLREQGEELAHVPIIFFSDTVVDSSDKIRGLSLGAADFIVEPVSDKEILLRIQNVVEHYLEWQQAYHQLINLKYEAHLSRILAATHHEIKNLVTLVRAVGSSLQSIIQQSAHDDLISQINYPLQAFNKTTDHLQRLTKSLAQFQHEPSITCEAVGLGHIFDELRLLTQDKLKGINVQYPELGQDKSNQLLVWTSPYYSTLILINFLLNAYESLEAMHKIGSGGRIIINLGSYAHEDGKKYWQIQVIDNGIGLARQELRRHFKPFVTTKRSQGGQGLGLWLAQYLAGRMGAHIEILSEGIGKGAEARLYLPQLNSN